MHFAVAYRIANAWFSMQFEHLFERKNLTKLNVECRLDTALIIYIFRICQGETFNEGDKLI